MPPNKKASKNRFAGLYFIQSSENGSRTTYFNSFSGKEEVAFVPCTLPVCRPIFSRQ
jgi:hypothetical protein